MSEIIDLEEMAETSDAEKNNTEKTTNKTSKNKNIDQMNELFQFPFAVAMQNLKVDKDKLIEAGRQMFEKGYYEQKIELPFGNNFVLKTSKAIDDLDYYSFVADAIQQEMNVEEFNYLLNIRNMAKALQSLKGESYVDYSTDQKVDMLLSMSAPLVRAMLTASKDFWSILMLMMHPDFVGFLMSETQV